MIALSVRQPWAWLIVAGHKDVENRSWRPAEKYIGQRILIHASLKPDPAGYDFAMQLGVEIPDGLPLGRIVGEVTIAGVQTSGSPWAFPGHKHWRLEQPEVFSVLVPCKGSLRLWEVPADVLTECLMKNQDTPSIDRVGRWE